MLHASQDPPCSRAVLFWNSQQGLRKFRAMVAESVQPPPAADDPELHEALRRAVPRVLIAPSDREVHERVVHAALDVAHRLKMGREMARRHHEFVHDPQPARHAVQYGEQGRATGELAYAAPSNPHYAKWLALATAEPPTR